MPNEVEALLARLARQQAILATDGTRPPARWRGLLRREIVGPCAPRERALIARAFDELARRVARGERRAVDANLLLRIHERAVGGGQFRRVGLRVGRTHEFPRPGRIPHLVESALARAERSREPAPLVAVRLHTDLIAIHPFRDGNGRSSRLLAAYVLMRAGWSSTLFTAMEQHFQHDPGAYLPILDRFRFGLTSERGGFADLLRAMTYRSALVSWFREREARLRHACRRAGLLGSEQEAALVAFDLGQPSDAPPALAETGVAPWTSLRARLPAATILALADQLARLRAEEADAALRAST